MEITAELRGEREFHQACAESVRRSLEDERQLRTQIDALAAKLATASARSAESGRIRARRRSAGAAAQARLEQERTAAADITNRLTGLLDQQLRALGTFNVVLFGRTGTGKSSLVEALVHGYGARVSSYGESDWTKDVEGTEWGGCQVFDTPGIGGWDTNVPADQLERARLAVACADVVVLCFDSQNQRAAEFTKVSEWIGEYDKAVIAVLNVRNEKWGIADLMPDPAARRACSVQVAQHVQHLRAELATIGLHRAPVIAVHARNAMFACASEPYQGPARGTRAARLGQLGPERLYQCSNVHVLERLLVTVIRQNATPLRLGSVRRLVAGAVEEAKQETAGRVRKAEARAAEREAVIAEALDIVGLPEPAPDDRGYGRFLNALDTLGQLRHGTFGKSFGTRTERYAKDLITSKLAPLDAEAQARADDFIEAAMRHRRSPEPGAFEIAVLSRDDLRTAMETALSEFREYLARHFELIAKGVRSDLDWLTSDQIRLRTSAGNALKVMGLTSSVGGIGASASIGVAAAAATSLMVPVLPVVGIAAGIGLVLEGLGVSWRRRGIGRREQALGEARAQAREVVREAFGKLADMLAANLDGLRRRVLADNLAEPLGQAIVLRRLARDGVTRTDLLTQFQSQLAAAAHAPQDLMTEAVRECESSQGIRRAAGRRRLWLGESWLDDQAEDLSQARAVRSAARPEVRDEIGRFAGTQGRQPRPGSGWSWLETVARELAGEPDAGPLVTELRRLAGDGHPRVVICGDYNSGKSSLIARLHREAGRDTPENLAVSAAPTGPVITEYRWEGFTLVDTPGFQADPDSPAEETIMEIASASVVLMLFTPGLILGDRADLLRTLYGDPVRRLPGKSGHTLLVINRADELGADPETGDEFTLLCEHKRAQLRESLAGHGDNPSPAHVVCVAADPYGAGQAHPWDGMTELAQALRAAHERLAGNAADVTILAGGLARIGALTGHVAGDLPRLRHRADELRGLERDLEAMVTEATELDRERRLVLRHEFSGIINGLISGALTERNAGKRRALVDRLDNLPADTQFRTIITTWSSETDRKVAKLEQAMGHRIGRRLADREFRLAVPELSLAVDTRALGSAKAKMAIGAGVGRLGGALGRLEKFSAGEAAATRLGRLVRIGGPTLSIAGSGYSAWSLIRGLRQDAARKRKQDETIRAFRDQGDAWADEISAHDSALAGLARQIELLHEALAGAAEETRAAATAAARLSDRIARYERLADQAATLLGLDTKGTP